MSGRNSWTVFQMVLLGHVECRYLAVVATLGSRSVGEKIQHSMREKQQVLTFYISQIVSRQVRLANIKFGRIR